MSFPDYLILSRVPIDPIPLGYTQRKEKRSDLIDNTSCYLIKYCGQWMAGKFSEVWHGQVFHSFWGAAGVQFDSIDGPIYKIMDIGV